MKFQKLWVFFCLVFAFHSLETLVEESYELTYWKSNETELIQFLVCEELDVLYPNQTEVDLKTLRDDLYNHLNRSIHRLRRSDTQKIEELVLNRIKSGHYLMLNRRVCLITIDWEFRTISYFFGEKLVYFATNGDTFDLVRMHRPWDSIGQLTVLKKSQPYSDCSESNARFHCLNECFRRSFKLARYFYEGNETGGIHLNYGDRNRSIEESERSCFGECKRENCKLIQLISVDETEKEIRIFIKARRKLSAFDYWIQLIGLICSFTGISLNEFVSVAIKFARSKVKRRKVRIALFCLKLATLLLGLASFGYLCSRVALDLKAEENNIKEKEGIRYLIQPKTVNLTVCVKNHDYDYEEMTMLEIERATDRGLDDVLEGIYVDYGSRSFRASYDVHSKIWFKNQKRCFLLSIRPDYQTTPSSPKLTVEFKDDKRHELYLLSENENLNDESFKYSGLYAFQKRIVKRLKSRGCINYEEKFANCTGRQNCVERCIARKLVEKNNRITFGRYRVVIDKDWFSPFEWNTSNPMRITSENLKIREYIRTACLQEIQDVQPCEETKFKETVKLAEPRDLLRKEIDLPFSVVRSVEEEPSRYKLALDLANIQGIIFGLTMLSILQKIASFVRTALRESKLVIFLLYLLCLLGASWHTYHILHLVVSGELVPTRYYELAKRVQMPVIVFCPQIDENLIDGNHQLTGSYLEELTNEMTAESTFANITYLNESNEWIIYNLSQLKRFFLHNMKCFRIEINQRYEEDQFRFSNDTQVLRVNFIKTNEGEKIVRFMTKSNEFAEFSKAVYLDCSHSRVYSITHETTLYKYEDRFSFIRRHFHLFEEDDANNLQRKLLELQGKEHNLRTLNLPLEREAFDMEVEEHLFEQLYSSIEKRTDKRTNYQQLFVDNHLRMTWDFNDWNFNFNLIFLQKVVSSTNEQNLGQLILNLLNVLFIWFDLGVLDLYPILPLSHDYLLIHLYLCLPAFICKRLKKLELSLSKLLIPNRALRQPNARRDRRF